MRGLDEFESVLLRGTMAAGAARSLVKIARAKLKQISENDELAILTLLNLAEIDALTIEFAQARSVKHIRASLDALVKRRRRQISAEKRRRANPPTEEEIARECEGSLLSAIASWPARAEGA